MKLAHYIAATALAEAFAQIASALVAESMSAFATSASAVYLFPLALVATGLVEGLAVGCAQGFVLRAHVPVKRFVLVTTLAMTASWAVGAVVSLVEPASAPSPLLVLGIAAMLGLVVGAALGLAQDRVFEHAGISGTRFIGYSALAWSMAQIALAMLSDLGDFTLSAEHLLYRGLAGLVGGAVAGLIAGPSLLDAIRAR